MSERGLTGVEKMLAGKVFVGSIDLDKVVISDGLGFSNRPYTTYFGGYYILHIGPTGFKDATIDDSTFIHELVHVWQGQHSVTHFGYMIRSVFSQWKSYGPGQPDAYAYQAGDDWSDYNVEQQAHIVENWYDQGMKTTSPLYRYIRDNILPGNN